MKSNAVPTVAPKAQAPKAALPTRRAAEHAPSRAPVFGLKPSREGRPLDGALRQRFEARFRRDFSDVRVHTNAGDDVQRLYAGAQAVTVGNDIFVKRSALTGEEGENLLAHELTHVAQQSGSTNGTASSRVDHDHDPLEAEARRNVAEYRQGRPLHVSRTAAGAGPQGEDEHDRGWFYNQVVRVVPALGPILDRGLFNWIGDRVNDVAASIMESLRGPLDTIRGIEASLGAHVARLIEWVKRCIAALARGDCSVLHEGIEAVEQAIDGLTAPAFEALKAAFDKVSRFFNGLWERFGAPLWTKIKEYAGAAWEKVEQFFGWVREKIQPVINSYIAGWQLIKSWIGIGDDPDSQNGLLQWAQRKLEALWERVKGRLEPLKGPLLVVAGILVLLSPAGPFIAIGAAIAGTIEAIRWIRRTFAVPGGVVSARQLLQQVILPRMISAITSLAQLLADKVGFIVDKLLAVEQKLSEVATLLGDSLVGFLAPPVRFVAGLFTRLVAIAHEKLDQFVSLVHGAATQFASFCMTVLGTLDEISHTLIDLMRIPLLLAGRLWNKIPACIRDPFVDFLGVQILGQIPIFQTIAGTPEAWQQTKEEVRAIIRTIFVDYDLVGAMKRVFRLMLRVLDVPMELLTAVLAKMDAAWDVIKARPAVFVKNLFRTMMLSLRGFFSRILTHLGNGIVGWLTKELQGTGVQLPSSWTDLGEVFRFVASVLGLSVEHVLELMARQNVPQAVIRGIRSTINFLSGAWEWVSLIVRGDFNAFWQRIREQAGNLKDRVFEAVRNWIMQNVIGAVMAQLITTADPTGISETIMLIVDTYRTIKTVIQYMRQILEMVQRMLDSILNIAAGTLQPAADLIEQAMDRGMPVVIGFLANLAGLGGLGQRIREIIGNIREHVDAAIIRLIELARSGLQSLSALAGAAMQWWRQRFRTRINGEEHSLTAHGADDSAQIFVESTPVPIGQFMDAIEANPKSNKQICAQIRAELAAIAPLRESMSQTRGEQIAQKMTVIANLLRQALPGSGEIPESVVVEHTTEPIAGRGGSESSTVGKRVKIFPLSHRPPSGGQWRGSQPGYGNPFFRAVNRRANTYVQGHLLNHHLYGPGQNFNLVPIHRQLNTTMSSECEERVKDAVLAQNKVVSYEVTVDFGGWAPQHTHIAEENDLPTSITMVAKLMKKKADNLDGSLPEHWVDDSSIFSGTRPNTRGPDTDPGAGPRRLKRVNVNLADVAELDACYGIGAAKAGQIMSGRPFGSPQDVATFLKIPSSVVNNEWKRPEVATTGQTEWE